MNNRIVVTITTIRVPIFLEDVCKNAIIHKHNKDNISFIIIGDEEEPSGIVEYCDKIQQKYGFKISYYDLEAQEKRLKGYPALLNLIPLNSGVRKLIGNFIAYLEGCDTLIMLDDDNFITSHDFFSYHSLVGKESDIKLMQTALGWYNIFEAVTEENNLPIYPRGYPWSKRFIKESPTESSLHRKIAVLNGLVLEDPDVDAVTRLFWPVRVTSIKEEFTPIFGLYPGTWAPWNNQNTSISKELIPIFFAPPSAKRASDIWTSFIICRLAEEMNEVVAFGYPAVRQFRNPHNLWKDLNDEIQNNKATDKFVELIRGVVLTKSTYLDLLKELIEKCIYALPAFKHDSEIETIRNFFLEYRRWASLF